MSITLSDFDQVALTAVLQFYVDQDDAEDLFPHAEWAKEFLGTLHRDNRRLIAEAKREAGTAPGPADSWALWDSRGHDPEIEKWLLAEGFEDSTWHNDICPSFHHAGKGLRLWIYEAEMADRETREGEEPRFELHQWNGDEFELVIASGETWAEILPHVEKGLVV